MEGHTGISVLLSLSLMLVSLRGWRLLDRVIMSLCGLEGVA